MAILGSTEAIVIEIVTALAFALLAAIYIKTDKKASMSKFFLSAHKSQNWTKVTVSLLATYIGNWTLYLPADFGAYYGLFGILSYVLSSIIPVIIIAYIGPIISNSITEYDFTSADHFRKRYGRIFHIILFLFSLMYMWISLCAELTTLVTTLDSLTNNSVPPLASILPVAISTLVYTAYSGLPASIFTDQYQGLLVVIMGIIVILSAALASPLNSSFWTQIEFAPKGSLLAGFSLILTVYPSELLNQACWQRILTCKNTRDIKRVCFTTSAILSIVIFVFGFLGIIAAYLYPMGYVSGQIFALISPLHSWILILVLIFAISLVSSSVDSLQNGMASLLGGHLHRYNLSLNWARFATVLINIPAIIVASLKLNVFNLFYTANLLCLTVATPQLLSFHSFFTQLGAICGFLIGFITIPIIGWIYTHSFINGLLYFYPSDIAHISYIIIGLVTPISSGLTTFLVSWIDRKYSIMYKENN